VVPQKGCEMKIRTMGMWGLEEAVAVVSAGGQMPQAHARALS
jgi:hypothetical protein